MRSDHPPPTARATSGAQGSPVTKDTVADDSHRVRIDIEIRNSVGKHGLGPGLDVRGQGGYAVVPCPGSGYRWDPHCNFDTVPPHPAPAWLGHRQKQSRTARKKAPGSA